MYYTVPKKYPYCRLICNDWLLMQNTSVRLFIYLYILHDHHAVAKRISKLYHLMITLLRYRTCKIRLNFHEDEYT